MQLARRAQRGDARLHRRPVALQSLGLGDFDAETGDPDIGARARRQELDRRDPQVAQDLRPEPHLAPLDAALALGIGGSLADRRGRDARGAVAQIDQDTLAGGLEAAECRMDGLRAAKDILEHARPMEPGRHVVAVADAAIHEGIVVDLVEGRHIGIARQFPDLAGNGEFGDPGHQLLARLPIGDQIGNRHPFQAVLLGEIGNLRPPHDRAVVVDQLTDRRHRRDAREPAEVDRRLGMPGAHQHAALLADQREDVARPDKVRCGRHCRWRGCGSSPCGLPRICRSSCRADNRPKR